MKLSKNQVFMHKPLRDILLNREELVQHGKEIARNHLQSGTGSFKRSILPHVADNMDFLRRGQAYISTYLKETNDIVPAAEWFLDNYYLLKDLGSEIAEQMPRRYEKQLPRLSDGPFRGYPRVLALMVELIEHTDSHLQLDAIKEFVEAYQTVAPLSSGEIWAIPIMLRVALLENIRRLVERVIYIQDQRQAAELWLLPFLATEHEADKWNQLLNSTALPEDFSTVFAERLLRRLRDFGQDAGPVLSWLDKQASKTDSSLEALAKLEHQNQAMLQVTMGHAITSLRFAGEEDWPKFFEQISTVEQILQQDPAQVYCKMDFESRDQYRHKVERLARHFAVSEIVIAKKVLELASLSQEHSQAHVGYFLLGKGMQVLQSELEQEWGALRQYCIKIKKFICSKPTITYLGGIASLTVLLMCVGLVYAARTQTVKLPALVILGIVLLIPMSSLALTIVNWAVTRLLKPSFLPKLDLTDGIPPDLKTMVVIPTLLSSVSRVRELTERIEVYYLANQDTNLHFAILGDFIDAPQEVMPDDEAVITTAVAEIKRLNDKYDSIQFHLFNRKRLWNPAEGVWMGWERKRGKLVEFNRLLSNNTEHSIDVTIGHAKILPEIKYIITLDSDTQLPREAAKKLIGTITHPLQSPILNTEGTRVIDGYGIIQPRIAVSLESAETSFFAKVFAGRVGVDPYTAAVSDVYQDLFGEGNFTGKGIYDVEVFHKVTGDIFPQNTILSHDLIEGIYARTGLVTDIELIDGYPSKVHAYMRRIHRWVRGDWQITPWLFKRLPAISRWKIGDNLRRSLEAPALVLLIVFSALFPGSSWVWLCIALLVLLLPCVLGVINSTLNLKAKTSSAESVDSLLQFVFMFCFLPYQAYTHVDAILRSLYRQTLSRRKMLEWEAAADTERRLSAGFLDSCKIMLPALIPTALLFLLAFEINPQGTMRLVPIIALWFVSPWIAATISRPRTLGQAELTRTEKAELRGWARKIWAFFEDFVTEKDNWLPPDNLQVEPPNGVAHRTSPTNIGLALLANQAARDLGYLSMTRLLFRVRHTLNSIDSLENWKGHLYNWYDTESLKPLHPLYVSTVDSGNLVVYFLTLEAGLEEYLAKPVIDHNQVNGLKDTYNLLLEELTTPVPPEFDSFARSCDQILQATNLDLLAWYNLLIEGAKTFATSQSADTYWGKHLQAMLADFLQEFNSLFSDLLQSGAELKQLSSGQISSLNLNELEAYLETFSVQPQALTEVRRLKTEIRELRVKLSSKAMSTDFLPLFDTHRQLFSIGYRIGEQTLDRSYYDLLASEARQASFIAIAKGDLAKSHWFRLGRSLTVVRGKRSLVSWSGTMFEFLMPLLVMRNYQGTILDETYRSVVAAQEWYGAQRKTPWGISESGFYTFDAQLNYQYKAFGVPGLGLKRGLLQELVVAPYATFLALMVAPKTALANIRAMKNLGFNGLYGLYEAADYSQDRALGGGFRLVQSFMAHHQGMSFISLTNVLFDNIMQKRFHSLPLVQSTELLLKERVPATGVVTPQPEEREVGIDVKVPALEKRVITLSTAETSVPVTHFLSNGQYAVMLTNSGSGYSKFAELSISRWREDVTKDSWGMYFYIQNLNSGATWSAAHQPCGYSGEDYKVTYAPDRAEYYRIDGNIRTKTEVIVSPEDQVEIRRISLTNNSQYDRTIEVTSYFEVVLARHSEDLAHPAFGNLFIETEFTHQSLVASRRPRRDDQARKWIMHTVAIQGESIGALQFETDRYKFVGRGRNLTNPRALEPNHPLSGTTGAVLDPILSLRQRVRLRPGQSVQVSFSVGIGESKEEVIRLAEKYRDPASIERVFELAWTYSQMELRHLGLASNQANDALSLGGNLLYLSPCRREYEEVIKSNCKGQSSLWPYAISGDLPMILVRISKIDDLDFVSQLLTIHEYWHIKGLVIDLVILNEDKSGYLQDLHDSLKELVAVGHAREMLNRPGGIFLLQKEHMPLEDVNLIFSVARQVFSAEGGSCSMQFRKLGKELLLAPKDLGQSMGLQVEDQASESAPVFPATEELEYYNGYGGFSKDGREYVILVRPNIQTPLPWSNVIANKHFGFLITESGGGYTWSTNSRENKLTPWSNDPVIDQSGEIIFLRDEQSGSYWSPIPGSIKQQEPYTVRHGQGYSKFIHESRSLRQELLLFVPKEEPLKILQLTLTNLSKEPRTLTGFYYAELVMGVAQELTAPYLVSEFDSENNCLLAANVYQQEFARRRIFLSCTGAKIKSYTADRTEFIGRNGNAQRPAALSRSTLLNSVGAGFDPCAAIQIEINLLPGECKTVCFQLGEGKNLAEVEQLLHCFEREDQVIAAFAEVEEFWKGFLGNLQVRTPDKSMDILLNRWLLYQTVVCRLWARSAFYQSGGAFGFRDQLQDVMALTPSAPQWTREQILLHCEHQFLEGDVQHWWHAEGSKGIRTKFSDDLLWLPFVTADYIEHTQDYGILTERAQYLEDDPLSEETDERYSVPRVSEQDGTVYEHCLKALERGLKFGVHGLPLIGSGDWNDGFSRVGVKGRGESVWLGWFIYLTLQRFVKICAVQGDTELTNHYAEVCSKLQESLELHGWDGGWYRRAYFDDGSPMGSARNQECQIDALAQSWAVLSGAAKPARAEDAMLALEHYLIRKDEGIMLLLTPPFNTSKPDPGYIKGYVPGVRENGGQYTHGAIWSVLALTKMGEGDRATELFQMLNPINHARTETEVAYYKVEPYVMTADVYAIPPHVGRGGWSWYTGAAGWMYQAGLEGILGFCLEGNKLYLKPCIPSAWTEFSIEYRYKTSHYTFQVNNSNGKNTGITGILVDGKAIQVGAVELVDDGSNHLVTYTM